jgi:predicted phosphodiesterase
MIRRFRNSKGETIEVDKAHLDKAVEIKLQLQKLSPSSKCNWKRHTEMMHEEGFTDADKTESYRLMVKDYQRDIGLLVQSNEQKSADNDQKVTPSIQSAIGELYYQKRALQTEQHKLNKLKKEFSLWSLISQEVRDAFLDELDLELPQFAFKSKLDTSRNKLVLIVTDWHVGAVVENCEGNYYNFEILKKRLEVLKIKVIDYCNLYNITSIDVVSLGDICEHSYMRNTQSYETEFNFSTQIVKATQVLIDLLVSLSHYVNVNFTGIAGNHDRMNGAMKNDNIDGDSVVRVVNYAVKMFIETSDIPRLSYSGETDNLLYSYVKDINGKKFKFLHGDLDKKLDKNKLEKHMGIDKQLYDCLVYGHFHHYSVFERNLGALEVQIGSIVGRNNFSKKLRQVSDASQGLLIVTEDGEILPQRIGLQIV